MSFEIATRAPRREPLCLRAPGKAPWVGRSARGDRAHPGASALKDAEHRIPVASRARRYGEVIACAALLCALALAMCLSHIEHGGLYYDDWSVLALGRLRAGGLIHGLWQYYGQRPGQVAYYAALDQLPGTGAAPRLTLAAVMLVTESLLLCTLLRELGMRTRDALACSALTLTLPFSDSVWLWGILSLASLSVAASLLGVLLALRALRRAGARAVALHAASLSMYVASVLSYELFALAGCLVGLIYVREVGLARARMRWAADVLVIVASAALTRTLLPVDIATPSHLQSIAGMLHHAGLIALAGVRVAGEALLPVGGAGPWAGVAALGAGFTLAAAVARSRRLSPPARAQIGRWLMLAGGGALLAAAAWGVFVPAPDHYSPSAAGTVNRVNALAAAGLALVIYAFVALGARALCSALRLGIAARAAAPLCLAALLCLAYLRHDASDARAWDRAASDQRLLLVQAHSALASPPRGAVLYAFGDPLTVGPGIPVLNTTLDLTDALRSYYGRGDLSAVRLSGARALRCQAHAVVGAAVSSRYKSAYLLDLPARRADRLASRAGCVGLSMMSAAQRPARNGASA